jgi:hypothetical protein
MLGVTQQLLNSEHAAKSKEGDYKYQKKRPFSNFKNNQIFPVHSLFSFYFAVVVSLNHGSRSLQTAAVHIHQLRVVDIKPKWQ